MWTVSISIASTVVYFATIWSDDLGNPYSVILYIASFYAFHYLYSWPSTRSLCWCNRFYNCNWSSHSLYHASIVHLHHIHRCLWCSYLNVSMIERDSRSMFQKKCFLPLQTTVEFEPALVKPMLQVHIIAFVFASWEQTESRGHPPLFTLQPSREIKWTQFFRSNTVQRFFSHILYLHRWC